MLDHKRKPTPKPPPEYKIGAADTITRASVSKPSIFSGRMLAPLVCLALFAAPALGIYNFAIDISELGKIASFQCLRNAHYGSVFVRAYKGSADVDKDAPANIKAAFQAGLGTEVFAVPKPDAWSSASTQMDDTLNALKKQGITVRTLWLQVTSPVNWHKNQQKNIDFILKATQRIRSRGVRPGIYTAAYDWQQITNNFGNLGSDVMLWYWHVFGAGPSGESPATFDDFRPFGQWNQPSVKQFAQAESLCGFANVNRDVYASNGASGVLLAFNGNETRVATEAERDEVPDGMNILVGGIGF